MSFRRLLLDIKDSGGRVLVVGLGISGVEAAFFLRRIGIHVLACERQARTEYEKTSKYAPRLTELEQAGAELYFGIEGDKVKALLGDVKLAVLSPGVSLSGPLCTALRAQCIQLVGEMELGVEVQGVPSIVVTGSNGKSTTVALLHEMFLTSGRKSRLCGNFGTPVVAELGAELFSGQGVAKLDVQVVEASSYQLEVSTVLRPVIGVLLNVSDNHLERHGTIERYLECKARLFASQESGDYAILNFDDARVRALAPALKATVCAIGTDVKLMGRRPHALIDYRPSAGIDTISLRPPDAAAEVYQLKGSNLIGLHNRYDIAAALLAARLWGVSREALQETILKFTPLEHRLEVLPGLSPVIINDSKSTTVAASVAAFEAVHAAYPDDRIVLMLGGLSKAGSWEPLVEKLCQHRSGLESVICFGGDGAKLLKIFEATGLPCVLAKGVEAALQAALERAATILFSPGCASFDEFRDFEERGRFFKNCAKRLTGVA